jgi:hypothetical protein
MAKGVINMFQALTDKVTEYAAPIFMGLLIWFFLHYAIITPRIIKGDLPSIYEFSLGQERIPRKALACGKHEIVKQTIANGRWHAALYTASFGHVSSYFHNSQIDVTASVNDLCGVTQAIAYNRAISEQERVASAARKAKEEQMKKNLDTLGKVFIGGMAILKGLSDE